MAKQFAEILFPIPAHKNMFTLEGIDGSGKSTQTKAVVETLQQQGIDTVSLTNPSDSDLGRFLRANLRTLPSWQRFSLFVMDMLDVLDKQKEHRVLIWDRYLDSTITSNSDTEPDVAARWVVNLPRPSHTYFLDIRPEKVINFRSDSLHDHSLNVSWQNLKYKRYKELYLTDPDRVTIIDASLSRETITSLITTSLVDRIV